MDVGKGQNEINIFSYAEHMGNLKELNLPFGACYIDSFSFLAQSPPIFQYFILPRMPIRVRRVKYVNPGWKVNSSNSSDLSANSNLMKKVCFSKIKNWPPGPGFNGIVIAFTIIESIIWS